MANILHDVNAYVLNEKNGIFSLKVQVHDLGMYLMGMTLRISKKNNDWWLQPPKQFKNGRYFADIEFDTSRELWKAMLEASIDAVNEYRKPYDTL